MRRIQQSLIHYTLKIRNVLNSTLPIEGFYVGEKDLSGSHRSQLHDLNKNLEKIGLFDYFDDSDVRLSTYGYAMKFFAALASRFEKVILIDTDVIFLQRPDSIFVENAALKDTSIFFWHDKAYRVKGDFSQRD